MTDMLVDEGINAGLNGPIKTLAIDCAFDERRRLAAISREKGWIPVDFRLGEVGEGGDERCFGLLFSHSWSVMKVSCLSSASFGNTVTTDTFKQTLPRRLP